MKVSRTRALRAIAALPLIALSAPVAAQGYGEGGYSLGYGGYDSPSDDDAPVSESAEPRKRRSDVQGDAVRTSVQPYLALQQVVTADLKGPNDNVVTYTSVAAGVDANVATRRVEATVSARYEHRFSYDDDYGDEDIVSGLGNVGVAVAPGFSVEAGGLAARSRVDVRGPADTNTVGTRGDNVTNVYSVYAGPSFSTNMGDVTLNAAYRAGYTKVDSKQDIQLADGLEPLDTFDDSVSHAASVAVGQQPGTLPFGWTVSGGYNREDASQLDQRFEQKYGRVDVTVPVSPTLALAGGVGYEDIQISERDALQDENGVPIVGNDGRLITDGSSPRLLSYDNDGLIWDVGVMWRPSSRTSLSAFVGRRYDSTTYYGDFTWVASSRTTVAISAYDAVTGFGSRLNDSLAGLGTSFNTYRNPLSGELNGCVFGGAEALCFNDALQSVAASTFRTRGITAQLSTLAYGWELGLGLGYNRHRFFASELGALADADGVIDENWFANFYVGRSLDAYSSFSANFYGNYLESGFGGADVLGLGANAAYSRTFGRHLSASLAAGLDHYEQDGFDSSLTASALLGMQYAF